jgi:hypothetical protein
MTMHQDDSTFDVPMQVNTQPQLVDASAPLPAPPRAGGDYIFDPATGEYTLIQGTRPNDTRVAPQE